MSYLRPLIVANFKPEKTARAPRPRRIGNSETHLFNIRRCPCSIPGCHSTNVQAHHLKATGARGAGMKSPDRFSVPLCHDHHINGVELVGSKNELAWFEERGLNALALAADLWASRGNSKRMLDVVLTHRMRSSYDGQ